MDGPLPECPCCLTAIATTADANFVGAQDHYCDSCSTLLRLRFFRGEVVDVEDLDEKPDQLN